MHTRTYADEKVLALADRFVWVIVDPTASTVNEDIADEYAFRLEEELGEFLSYPTAVFFDAEGGLRKAGLGWVPPDEFVKMMKEILGE
jgi:hypothetical protein